MNRLAVDDTSMHNTRMQVINDIGSSNYRDE